MERTSVSQAVRYCPVKEAVVRVDLGENGVVLKVRGETRMVEGNVC